MSYLKKQGYRFPILIGMLAIFAVLVAACAGSNAGSGSSSTSAPSLPGSSSQGSASSGGQKNNSSEDFGPPYLIKSLQVDMAVKDTRSVAADLQAWINATDPRSSSMGIDYTQTDDNLYNVSMKFSV